MNISCERLTVEGSSMYTTAGAPIREMATLKRLFIPPTELADPLRIHPSSPQIHFPQAGLNFCL